MKKSQLILLAAGIVAVGGLYALPKAVVYSKGDADSISQENEAATSSSRDAASLHEAELSSDQLAEIESLRKQTKEGDSKQGKISASVKLAEIFQELSKYDSAGYYLGLAFEENQDLKVAEKAGFENCHIELWQFKNTTSHKYKLLENILTVQKPK
jgi:hypothetical protein